MVVEEKAMIVIHFDVPAVLMENAGILTIGNLATREFCNRWVLRSNISRVSQELARAFFKGIITNWSKIRGHKSAKVEEEEEEEEESKLT